MLEYEEDDEEEDETDETDESIHKHHKHHIKYHNLKKNKVRKHSKKVSLGEKTKVKKPDDLKKKHSAEHLRRLTISNTSILLLFYVLNLYY